MANNKKQKGFTVIEALVSVFIFSIMALVVGATFVRATAVQRRSFSAQVIQEGALAVLETMAKEIRVSEVSNQNNNCTTDPPLNQLTITHPSEGSITYRLNAGGFVERVVGGITYYLSYQEITFNNFRFCVLGSSSPSDNQSSRVTILASVSNSTGGDIITVNVQTTVTSRYINNEL